MSGWRFSSFCRVDPSDWKKTWVLREDTLGVELLTSGEHDMLAERPRWFEERCREEVRRFLDDGLRIMQLAQVGP